MDNKIVVPLNIQNPMTHLTHFSFPNIRQAEQEHQRALLREQLEQNEEIIKLTKEQIENQEEIKKLLKEQAENGIKRPDYVTKLIESGLVYIDGITALEGLDKIADYLTNDWKMDFLSPELLLQFRQKNGSQFSLNTAREAIKRAKTK